MTVLMIGVTFGVNAQSAGTMRYNDTKDNYEFYDGSNWYQFSTISVPLSFCSKTAEMDYDGLLKTFSICDGRQKKLVAGTVTLTVCTREGTIDYRNNSFMYCNGLLWVNMKGLLS